VAHSRTEANFLLKDKSFDLAILDIMLPDGKGFQIYEDLKAKFPHLYCIMITGHTTLDNAVEAINQGVDAYLLKPFTVDQFNATLNQANKIIKLRTDHQRLQEENLTTRQFFENLLNSTGEAVIVVNLDFNIQYCNFAAQKFLNSDKEILINHNLQFYIDDGYKVLNHIYQQLMVGKKIGGYRVNLKSTNDEKYEVNLSADFLYDHNEHIEGIIITMEISSLQNELFNRILRKEKFATLTNLANALAHEIRNPINILYGRMQLLINEINDPNYRKTFATINRQVDRISDIIKLLVKFNSNRDDTIPEAFHLIEFFKDFTEKYLKKNPSVDIHISFPQNNKDILIEANRIQFEDAFSYLFTAINEIASNKYKVDVTYNIAKSFTPKPRVVLRFEFNKYIPLENIFEPFKLLTQQGSQSSLELAIMHTIFSNYNVKLSTDNLQNNNSVLILQFPISEIVELDSKSSNKRASKASEKTNKS
jgi:YesN/AraC family two-component response regulator